ncbi:MAG: TonB-dependent receptor plug domain-containing protein, partial [Gammaproteobacteria bacterium]|nr:TonB-dependent receptor plug domain-containing protein [Gammaproteobacteria bacterium]
MPKFFGSLSTPVALAAAGFLSMGGVPAVAGDDGTERSVIDQIVVVAHKDARSIREVAANVTAMSRDDLTASLATSVNDVFRYVPGVDTEAAGTRFGTEGINIRGIGGNRVAIVVDGVPLSDHFDVGSFSNATRDFIDAGLIQRVEVLHGPASALYGSSAIGGVVAVTTPDPFDLAGPRGFGSDLTLGWRGSDDSRYAQAMMGAGDRSLGFMAGVSYRAAEQLDSAAASTAADTRDTRRLTAMAKLVGDNRWGHTWRTSLAHQHSNTRSDLN